MKWLSPTTVSCCILNKTKKKTLSFVFLICLKHAMPRGNLFKSHFHAFSSHLHYHTNLNFTNIGIILNLRFFQKLLWSAKRLFSRLIIPLSVMTPQAANDLNATSWCYCTPVNYHHLPCGKDLLRGKEAGKKQAKTIPEADSSFSHPPPTGPLNQRPWGRP